MVVTRRPSCALVDFRAFKSAVSLKQAPPKEKKTQRPHFRAFKSAVSLKLVRQCGRLVRRFHFRAFKSAVSLKQDGFSASGKLDAIFPRLQKRGLIEAIRPVTSEPRRT